MALRMRLTVTCIFVCLSSPIMAMRKLETDTITSASQDEQSKWCWFSGSSTHKDYYFEGMFDLPDSRDHTALQLRRHPESPKLRIHKVTQWVVRTPPKEHIRYLPKKAANGDILLEHEGGNSWRNVGPDRMGIAYLKTKAMDDKDAAMAGKGLAYDTVVQGEDDGDWVRVTIISQVGEDLHSSLPWIDDVKDPKNMQWLPACMKAGGQEACSPDDVVEIDLLNVSYITIIPEIEVTDPNTGAVEPEMGMKIVFTDGNSTEFVGGLYLPRKLMMAGMKRAEKGNFSGLGQDAKEQSSETDNMADAGWSGLKDTVTGTYVFGSGSGVAAGVGVAATVIMAGTPLYGSAVGTILAGAGIGLLGGSGVGLALGAVLGTVVGGGAALADYHKQKKELGLSAVEKIWSKLECHDKMIHCNQTLIVPKGKVCPEA